MGEPSARRCHWLIRKIEAWLGLTSYSLGLRTNQLSSIPGKNAPPTQFSSAAWSRPQGVGFFGGAGRSFGSLEAGHAPLLKLPSFHCRSSAYWTAVNVSQDLRPPALVAADTGRRGAPGVPSSSLGSLELSSISSSPISNGMLAPAPAERLLSEGGLRSRSDTRARFAPPGAPGSASSAQFQR